MATLEAIRKAGGDGKLLASTVENIEAWLGAGFLPDWALTAIDDLVAQEAWEELNDRFYKQMAFGTGGMRGRTIGRVSAAIENGVLSESGEPAHPAVGTNVLNDFNVARATIGLFRYCQKFLADEDRFDTPSLVIAYDVRHFSRHFCELAASTWTQLGGRALIFDGPRSTPQLSFSVRYLKATAGIVITASHNPPHDNGFKAYFEDGAQVVAPHAEGIIGEVNQVGWSELPQYLEKDLSRVTTPTNVADDEYIDVLQDNVLDPEVFENNPLKVVFTQIHGTGAVASIPAMEAFGIDVITVDQQNNFDGRFPTVKSPNPENAEALKLAIEKANETGADVVMATDPDADRMGVAVRNSAGEMELLTGNMIGSLLAEYRVRKLKEMEILPPEGTPRAALIKTFVTTPLQAAIAENHGLKLIDTLTGFKWIGEKLGHYQEELEEGLFDEEGIAIDYDKTDFSTRVGLLLEYSTFYVFGGEESYGYLASDRVRDKDANAAVLMFCELAASLKRAGKSVTDFLEELYLEYGYYLEKLINIYYEGAAGAAKIKNIIETYRASPPKQLGDFEIAEFLDFGVDDLKDADGKPIPKENFYFLKLTNGYSYAVRGSGTEPKIKFYCFAREAVSSEAELESVKEETAKTLDALAAAIEKDARERAERG